MRIRQLASALVLLGSASAYAQDNSFLIDPNVSPEGGTLANCDAFPDYQQPLDSANFGTARTSDAQIPLEVAEDIVSGTAITTLPTGTIAGVRFWGISAEFNPAVGFVGQCLEDNAANTPYTFNFYADNAGAPGALLGTRTAAPTATDTTIPFAFATIFQYDANFAPIDNTNVSWISIQRQTGVQATSGNDCYFLWVNETNVATYDNFAVEILTPTPAANDQVMCLLAGPTDADVSIVKTSAAPTPLLVGSTVTYTLAAANAGPGDADNVVVSDTLPNNLTHVSNTCGATVAGQAVTWNIGMLANGGSASCDVVTMVNDFGPIANTATIATTTNDPTPANNSSTDSLAGVPFPADVGVTLTSDAPVGSLGVGTQFTYTVTGSNAGPGVANDLLFTLTLSGKVSFVSSSCGAVAAGNSVTWTVATLAVGASTSCAITVAVVAPGDLLSSVTVTTSTDDPNLVNNTAELVVGFIATQVPTLGQLGLLLLGLILAGAAVVVIRR